MSIVKGRSGRRSAFLPRKAEITSVLLMSVAETRETINPNSVVKYCSKANLIQHNRSYVLLTKKVKPTLKIPVCVLLLQYLFQELLKKNMTTAVKLIG